MSKGRVVLAYSGGLDTACILKVLEERGWEVIAFIADVGQQEDFDAVARRAVANGAVDVVVVAEDSVEVANVSPEEKMAGVHGNRTHLPCCSHGT